MFFGRKGHGLLRFDHNSRTDAALRSFSVYRLDRKPMRLATTVNKATEEKVRDLRKRAQWLKRYSEDKPYLASILNTAANKLEAEARALEAELPLSEKRPSGENT